MKNKIRIALVPVLAMLLTVGASSEVIETESFHLCFLTLCIDDSNLEPEKPLALSPFGLDFSRVVLTSSTEETRANIEELLETLPCSWEIRAVTCFPAIHPARSEEEIVPHQFQDGPREITVSVSSERIPDRGNERILHFHLVISEVTHYFLDGSERIPVVDESNLPNRLRVYLSQTMAVSFSSEYFLPQTRKLRSQTAVSPETDSLQSGQPCNEFFIILFRLNENPRYEEKNTP